MTPTLRVLCNLLMGSVMVTATLPTQAATRWAKVDDVHLRYELSGTGGDTVVLIHEMSMSLEGWDDVVPVIQPGRVVLRYDLRGFGLSQRIRDGVTMQDELRDLSGLLDQLHIQDKVILVGGAVGGAIALQFAAAYPARVKGVVAISPAAYLTPQPQRVPTGGAAPPSAEVMERLQEDSYPTAIRRMHPQNFERYLAIQSASDRSSGLATAAMVYSSPFKDVLPTIHCPALIVVTSLYKARPVEDFQQLASAIPHGRLAVLQTGHFAAIESPELVTPVLLEFMATLNAAH